MPMAIYMKYGNIKGPVTSDGFEDWIELQWGAGSAIGSATGPSTSREHSPLRGGARLFDGRGALIGNIVHARLHLGKLEAEDPSMTIRRFVEKRASVPLDAMSPAYLRGNARMLECLRRAGMPER